MTPEENKLWLGAIMLFACGVATTLVVGGERPWGNRLLYAVYAAGYGFLGLINLGLL
jgi:hypothetical protein